MDRFTFSTELVWEDSIEEHSADVVVLYSYYPGFSGSLIEPPEPAGVEIISITPADPTIVIPEWAFEDDGILAEAADDYAAHLEEAAEWRAQDRRDRMLMGES